MSGVPNVPPHSVEAERGVLGAVLIDNGAWPAVSYLTSDDWYRTDHRTIYASIAELVEDGRPIDAITVASHLDNAGLLDVAGGLAYLAEFAENTPSSANAGIYADIVREHAKRRRLMAIGADLADRARQPRSSVRDLATRTTAELAEIERLRPDSTRTTLLSMADLLAGDDEETEWLVDGLLPAGGLSLILGKPKAGKSTLARGLCVAVSNGGTWLGRECDRGPVVLVALEEKRVEVRRHFQSLGVTADSQIHSYIDRLPQNCNSVEWLRDTVAPLEPKLIVIDPLGRFVRIRDGGNDYTDATRQLEPLISYVRDSTARTHVALVHHSRKSAGDNGDESLGSTAILGSVDTAISLRREKGDTRMLYSVNRYGQDLPETFVSMDPETGWVTLGTTKSEAATKCIEDAILDFVMGSEDAPSHKDILESSEITGARNTKQRCIVALVDAGRLRRDGDGNRGSPFRYSLLLPI